VADEDAVRHAGEPAVGDQRDDVPRDGHAILVGAGGGGDEGERLVVSSPMPFCEPGM